MKGKHARRSATRSGSKWRWLNRKRVLALFVAGAVPMTYVGTVVGIVPLIRKDSSSDPFDPRKPFVVTVRHFYSELTEEALAEPLPPGPDRLAFLSGSYSASPDTLRRFAEQHLGAQIGPEMFTLTFQARGQATLQMIDISVVDVHKRAPYSGAIIVPFTQGGGPDPTLPVSLDLAQRQPRLLGADGQPVAESHSLTLRTDQPVVLDVTATSPGIAATWLFEVRFVGPDGKQGTVKFDGEGNFVNAADQLAPVPFAITDEAKQYTVTYAATPAHTFVEKPFTGDGLG